MDPHVAADRGAVRGGVGRRLRRLHRSRAFRRAGRLEERGCRGAGAAACSSLLKNPRWLMGVAGDTLGFVLQAIALSTGPVVLIQPLLVLALPISLPVARWLGGPRPGRAQFMSCGWIIIGLGAFFAIVGNPGDADPLDTRAAVTVVAHRCGGGDRGARTLPEPIRRRESGGLRDGLGRLVRCRGRAGGRRGGHLAAPRDRRLRPSRRAGAAGVAVRAGSSEPRADPGLLRRRGARRIVPGQPHRRPVRRRAARGDPAERAHPRVARSRSSATSACFAAVLYGAIRLAVAPGRRTGCRPSAVPA